MKALLLLAFSIVTLGAEPADWEIVNVAADTASSRDGRWVFMICNRSDEVRHVGEDWRAKGKAAANLYLNLGSSGLTMKFFAERCHSPQTHVKVAPGATIDASLPYFNGDDFDWDNASLAIIAEGELEMIGSLADLVEKGQQDGADQPATRSGVEAGGSVNPEPEPKGSCQ